MADIFDVVADATRRDLLARLLDLARDPGSARGEISVGELVSATGISQPTVSKHLKVLREHGLVRVREEGQHRYYRLDPAPLREVDEWVAPFAEGDEVDDDETVFSTAFSAWSGAGDAGSRLGRVAAERAHQARSVVADAQEKLHGAQEFVQERIGKLKRD
jgi:ArsR family transcriptional regulator, arsenate/arsenite/antimonite-responsive transcriptional repressor